MAAARLKEKRRDYRQKWQVLPLNSCFLLELLLWVALTCQDNGLHMSFALWLAFKFWQNRCTRFSKEQLEKRCPCPERQSPSSSVMAIVERPRDARRLALLRQSCLWLFPRTSSSSEPFNCHFAVLCANNSWKSHRRH